MQLNSIVGNLMDQQSQQDLYDILMDEERDWGDRYNAICGLEDEELIKSVLELALDPDIRCTAIRMVDDQDTLSNTSLMDPDTNVRAAAMEGLANWQRDTFKIIAIQDSSWVNRRAAVDRLPAIYDEFFADLMISEEDFRVRRAAMRKMKMIKLDIELLAKLAQMAQDGEVRSGAGRLIEDESILKVLTIHSGDYVVAEEAIKRISNQEYLKIIALEADFAHTRMTAVKKVEDENFLMEIARSDTNLLVRGGAIHCLNSHENLETLLLLGDTDVKDDIEARIAYLHELYA